MHAPLRSTDPFAASESPAGLRLEHGRAGEELGAEDWAALAPSSFYARFGRPCLRFALLLAGLPPALLVGAPIALVNACVFADPRRVFFRQERVGHRGRVFSILKFRTMRDRGPDASDDSVQDHERVTRFGRFLRNTHLDELPQLVNILRGEMDFIGPRPEMLPIDAWARARIPRFHERYAVRPGLTGLAQITQGYAPREEHAYRRKLALDRCLLASTSLALDLEILARTAAWMLRGRGWRSRPRGARSAHP